VSLEDELRATERRRLAALVSGDVELARSLHADDYELVTPGGRRLNREAYLDGVGSGRLHYLVFEPASEIRVRLHETVAILRYEARIEMEMPDGIDRGNFWHTDVYELRDDRWQAVWSQATRIRSD
jgi:phage baseplate assembly protein W